MINSSDKKIIVKRERLSNGEHQNTTFVNVLNDSTDDGENNKKRISKRILNRNNKLLALNNTINLHVKEEQILHVKRSFKRNKSKIANTFIKNEIKTETSLNDALNECIIAIGNFDDGYSYDKLLEDAIANCATSPMHSNFTPKRKILRSNAFDSNYNCDIERLQTCANKIQKLRAIKKIKLEFKSPQKIVNVPNKTDNLPSTVEDSKNILKQFSQEGSCLNLPSYIKKCIECNFYQMQTPLIEKEYDNNLCRFYEFRLFRFNKLGKLCVVGYPDPYTNIKSIDLIKWLPNKHLNTPSSLDLQTSIKILKDAGGQFCKLIQDEKNALKLNWKNKSKKKRKVLWKRSVNSIREICDVCKASIFNYHWTCGKCGFVVCIDCFRKKLGGSQFATIQINTNKHNDKNWLLCSNQKEHKVNQLTITQILAGDVLSRVSELMHNTCIIHDIHIDCNCNPNLRTCKQSHVFDDSAIDTFLGSVCGNITSSEITETTSHFLSFLSKDDLNILTSETEKIKSENINHSSNTNKRFPPKLLLMFGNKSNVPHMQLCDGLLLRLLDPKNDKNYELFQEQWKRGQPVLVSNIGKDLSSELWNPESFSRDFGNQKNDIIDFTTSNVFNKYLMCKFWDGFENAAERLCDKHGNRMLLKLKDWTPSADFANTFRDRFKDLMNCLPLKEYTHRSGRLNLVSYLPESYITPELGPKIYAAYGNAGRQLEKYGTTNLHVDILDSINLMVYVAITKNCKENDYNWYVKEALKAIEEAGCDDLTMRRIKIHGEIPGALWHIYDASDARAIRNFLVKIAYEHGTLLKDPIHDQSYYLNNDLRQRLFREYGVKGYSVVQFYGDAVFIPAGAPHQVRNLHNCIKVAESFVSPENVYHSLCMIQEFHYTNINHSNHKDKLQVKNILFYAIKNSLSVLMSNRKNNI